MISRTFITEYLKLFFPNYDERYLDLLEIISDFTDPYIEASNMAIIALDQNKRIVMVNQLAVMFPDPASSAPLWLACITTGISVGTSVPPGLP